MHLLSTVDPKVRFQWFEDLGRLGVLASTEDTLNNLLLLNEESADNARMRQNSRGEKEMSKKILR